MQPAEPRVDCRADCLDGPCGHRVDDAHRIAVGVGHIQHLTAAGKKQFVGMLLSRQRAGNLERLGVDQRNRRVVPEADVQAFARLVPGQSVRVGIGRQRNQVADCARGRVEPGKRVAVDVGDPQGLAIGRQGQSAGNLEAFLGIGVRQRRLVREQTPGVVEAIDAVVEAAADKELLAVGRPDQAVKVSGRATRPMILPVSVLAVTTSCSPYPACRIASTGSLGSAICTGKSPSRVCRPAGLSDQPLGRERSPRASVPARWSPAWS